MAREFGITNVDAMLESMSAKAYRRWIAFFSIYGFSDDRADLRSAIVACTVYNMNRGRRSSPKKPIDFMPKFGPKRRQTPEEMNKKMKMFAKFHNLMMAGQKNG